ncbi:MAG: hypothetical protein QOI17_1719 [Gaiellales bacterium]|jgi:hypothetical protein|nr:hypothetical protein [Gaiellales bacterium]
MAGTYLYARIGRDDRIAVLRLPIESDDIPLPGGDHATTAAVGSLVVQRVELGDAGNPVLIAYDPTPTRGELEDAIAEGWQRPPAGDPWVPMLTEPNDSRQPA